MGKTSYEKAMECQLAIASDAGIESVRSEMARIIGESDRAIVINPAGYVTVKYPEEIEEVLGLLGQMIDQRVSQIIKEYELN